MLDFCFGKPAQQISGFYFLNGYFFPAENQWLEVGIWRFSFGWPIFRGKLLVLVLRRLFYDVDAHVILDFKMIQAQFVGWVEDYLRVTCFGPKNGHVICVVNIFKLGKWINPGQVNIYFKKDISPRSFGGCPNKTQAPFEWPKAWS